MAIITSIPGYSEWRDEFDIFFNTTAGDCSGGTNNPSECQSATLNGQQRDSITYNISASAGNRESFTVDALQVTATPTSCATEVNIAVQTENGDDMIYDGSNMPFISETATDRSWMKLQWNGQAQ
jgi:hypothetical protein